jgi:hypothetical protein
MVFSFFPSRKAQGMSLKVVIVAVIALVILIVLIFIMTGKVKLFSKTAASCESKGVGAKCIAEGEECNGPTHRFGTDCAERFEKGDLDVGGPVCCVPIG